MGGAAGPPRVVIGRRPPALAVVIPSHNRRDRLRRTVLSVLAQRGIDEIVVVDDGSDPPVDFGGIIDPRLHLVRHAQNRGVSAARNTGWQSAAASHLVFVDDDDTLLPFAGRAFCAWRGRGNPGRIVVGSLLTAQPVRLPRLRRPPASHAGEIWGLDRHLLAGGRDFATKQATLIPRVLLEQTGGWDEALTSRETSELFFRLTAVADVEARAWPVYGLDRGTHPRLTQDRTRREQSVAYIREKHAALLLDPARRAAFEDNHATMMALTDTLAAEVTR